EERPVVPVVGEWPEDGPREDDRSADAPAVVVLAKGGLSLAHGVSEPVVRVEDVVAQVLEDAAVDGVRARARRELDLAARTPPELGRVGRGLDLELLERVD